MAKALAVLVVLITALMALAPAVLVPTSHTCQDLAVAVPVAVPVPAELLVVRVPSASSGVQAEHSHRL